MVRYDLDLFEVWKTIPGYEDYEVSSDGRVWSNKRQKFLRKNVCKNGYEYVGINNKTKPVHRLVLEAFCPNSRIEYTDVNHKNEIKTDNRLVNLEWCSRKYNVNYGVGKIKGKVSRQKTMVSTGRWREDNIGLSRKEYNKKYHQEHREELLQKMKEYKIRRKLYAD